MRLFLLLLPWLELFTLIQLGIETSALTAIFYVLATVVLGLMVLRKQGRQMFERLQGVQQGRVLGTSLLVDDMAMGLAGLLLIFPGMISDFAALVVMIGPLRRRLARALGAPQPEPYAPQRDFESEITIEGQYTRVDEDKKP
ncbi:FxsA family protein [Seongchinamella sediminis]|uniref:FxsA family protein n=1 Tax=Seongchinamella sediminis TaxID=2283635 RepID=A0A3L7E1H9_9GAMM|nr:FxsA family protein [Seongchinamella sediminis]RLQ23698.1 FxsA family protein [Seongchinamella sediminis]